MNNLFKSGISSKREEKYIISTSPKPHSPNPNATSLGIK